MKRLIQIIFLAALALPGGTAFAGPRDAYDSDGWVIGFKPSDIAAAASSIPIPKPEPVPEPVAEPPQAGAAVDGPQTPAEEADKDQLRSGDHAICGYSWEERPGTADYTIWDAYHRRALRGADRSAGDTLQGSRMVQAGNSTAVMCGNARKLKACFDKAGARAEKDPLASGFLTWAKAKGIDPTLFRMAIAMQETNLGGLKDSCSGGSCNGVGMNQIITIVTDSGAATNSSSRPEWTGITHNILTNMKYGIRVLALKVRETNPGNLRSLARYYNGSSTADHYAGAVERNYKDLSGKCGF
ncbi:MAG: hypothetical protein WCK76_04800 [Elusimicrobiota bacterium]